MNPPHLSLVDKLDLEGVLKYLEISLPLCFISQYQIYHAHTTVHV